MEQRYQVFVSSTFRDLHEERQQVIQALLELDCIPAGMELFPASDESQWTLIQRVIDDCDYYIVIIGGRYGSVDKEGISYTEREYDYAVGRGIPVLSFLHADPGQIPAGRSEIDSEARAKLDSFRAKAEQKMCRYWKSPEELGGLVSRSLVQTMKILPGEGWVRGRDMSSPEEVIKLRATIDQLTAELESVRIEPPPETQGLAQGSDRFEIRYVLNRRSGEVHTFGLSWDEIFACVGPSMFDEAAETDLRRMLIEKIGADVGFAVDYNTRINDEDFQTIKVQLIALGLIQKSVKQRSLRDSKTYWALTRYGEHYATVLKAIRVEAAVKSPNQSTIPNASRTPRSRRR